MMKIYIPIAAYEWIVFKTFDEDIESALNYACGLKLNTDFDSKRKLIFNYYKDVYQDIWTVIFYKLENITNEEYNYILETEITKMWNDINVKKLLKVSKKFKINLRKMVYEQFAGKLLIQSIEKFYDKCNQIQLDDDMFDI